MKSSSRSIKFSSFFQSHIALKSLKVNLDFFKILFVWELSIFYETAPLIKLFVCLKRCLIVKGFYLPINKSWIISNPYKFCLLLFNGNSRHRNKNINSIFLNHFQHFFRFVLLYEKMLQLNNPHQMENDSWRAHL